MPEINITAKVMTSMIKTVFKNSLLLCTEKIPYAEFMHQR